MKKLYGVGTGPGDKELLTLKAVKVIEGAKIIFAPNNKGKNMALDTAYDYVHGKRIILLDFHMGEVKMDDYIKAAKTISSEIPSGEYGVFLTIGDPMIYSTFIYLMEELEKIDIEVEIVPGIPSFIAGAAKSKIPITLKGDKFLLWDEFEDKVLDYVDSICILKTLNNKKEILDSFDRKNFDYRYIKRCTLEDEQILTDREIIVKDRDYISFIMGRRKKYD